MQPVVVPSGSGRYASAFASACQAATSAMQGAQQLWTSAQQLWTSVQTRVCSLKRKYNDPLLRDELPMDQALVDVAREMYNAIKPHGFWRLTELDFLALALTNARCHPGYPFAPRGDLLTHVLQYIDICKNSNLEDKEQKLAELRSLFHIPEQDEISTQDEISAQGEIHGWDEQQRQNDERERRLKKQCCNSISQANTGGSGSSYRSNTPADDALAAITDASNTPADDALAAITDAAREDVEMADSIACEIQNLLAAIEAIDQPVNAATDAAIAAAVERNLSAAQPAGEEQPAVEEQPTVEEQPAVEEQLPAQHRRTLFV